MDINTSKLQKRNDNEALRSKKLSDILSHLFMTQRITE